MNAQGRGRQILIHGLALVLFGLLWGLAVPHTPFPRLALGAHIQFAINGMLFILMAVLLISLPHAVSARAAFVMWLAAWLTWLMGFSEVANAWWGTREILPLAAQQAGASGASAWQELLVTLAHVLSGTALLLAWSLLLAGFVKHPGQPR
ncbi:hypothetical protein [Pseudomonas sp. N040]|uniref:hypothetical protein n=1 Tax=Pseudomonas sp. N040 TaxID=2785325 RepID=UPI0018A2FADA|nr:hypothetical protein [Pseudomonas sp. N040]MBF7731085.1 hypothetical protein [Pseudomonas sp. N040]MBW7014728.1 hypothetical protein [Pseudomonas sp. N040]